MNYHGIFTNLVEYAETEDKKREESESDVNQTAELCDADTVESSLPPDSRQKRLADLQAERAACDPAHLQGIKVRTFDRVWCLLL